MTETRTWEQMKRDNDGAVWIMENGSFCEYYEEDGRKVYGISAEMEAEQRLLEPWQRIGFNGCWSCANAPYCEKYIKTLERN